MRIIERHIIFSVLKIFFTTIFIFCFLFVLTDITSSLDEIIDLQVPLNILLRYYMYYIPIVFIETSAIACLIATLLTYGLLNQHNEVIVMRASGMSFWQITRPAIIFGLVVSMVVFWVKEVYIPEATLQTETIEDEYMKQYGPEEENRDKEVIENMTFYGLQNRLYFIEQYDPADFTLRGIIIIEYDDEQNIQEKIVALDGQWTGIAWKFSQVHITTYNPDEPNKPVKIKAYREKLMDITEKPQDFERQHVPKDFMNIKQLKHYIDRFSNSGAKRAIQNLKVDLYEKIAYPFGNFVIIFVGLPFALMVRSRKRSIFTSLGMAIVIGFFYFVINAISIAFGKAGILPPILAAWVAPLFFIGVAILAIESDFSN